MTTPCFEIVTYTAGGSSADQARQRARELLAGFPGFMSWIAFAGMGDPTRRADLVVWRSKAEAEAAAQVVGSDPAFEEFRGSITSVTSMGHYTTDDSRFVRQF